mmetsp:Transcript_34123/g.54440  ORF Transcript_34123/g.54440 Transcript_34123/m.54440 type:complete len:571 (+) Transcript_34123:85-1797(+)
MASAGTKGAVNGNTDALTRAHFKEDLRSFVKAELCDAFKELLQTQVQIELDRYFRGGDTRHYSAVQSDFPDRADTMDKTESMVMTGAESFQLNSPSSNRVKRYQSREDLEQRSASVQRSAKNSYSPLRESSPDETEMQPVYGGSTRSYNGQQYTEILNPQQENSRDVKKDSCLQKWCTLEFLFNYLGLASGVMVLLNALCVGLDTDHRIRFNGEPMPGAARSELLFCIYFTGEIVVRIFMTGWNFVCGSDYLWNGFDTLIVVLQISEQITIATSEIGATASTNLNSLRMLRLLRVMRILRLVRVLHLFDELRQIVASMATSFSVLLWSLLILFLVIYIFSVVFLELIANSGEDLDKLEVKKYFGSLPRTIFTMFESIVGGLNWDDVVTPLIEHISPFLGFAFGVYVATSMFAIMNMLTGVFVDRATQCVREDKDFCTANQIRNLFLAPGEIDDGSMDVNWSSFQEKMTSEIMQNYLTELKLDITEAEGLFDLLDQDKSGSVSSQEIVDGCLRLRGPARALDLALLMREVSLLRESMKRLLPQRESEFRNALHMRRFFNKMATKDWPNLDA